MAAGSRSAHVVAHCMLARVACGIMACGHGRFNFGRHVAYWHECPGGGHFQIAIRNEALHVNSETCQDVGGQLAQCPTAAHKLAEFTPLLTPPSCGECRASVWLVRFSCGPPDFTKHPRVLLTNCS